MALYIYPRQNARRRLTAFPPPGILNLALCGSSSVVEHRLAKARVASSNLVSRSIPPSGASRVGYGGLERVPIRQPCQRRGTQVVRERSAKPLCVGSIPTRASILIPIDHPYGQPESMDSRPVASPSIFPSSAWPGAFSQLPASGGTNGNLSRPKSCKMPAPR